MSERDYQCLLRLSTWAFLNLLAPELTKIIGGKFIPVEGTTVSHLVTTLDQLAGIDAWHVKWGQGVRGMASRIQFIAAGGSAWPTFTIRAWRASGAATELQKRREAIADDHIYPYWMTEAYVEGDRLLGFALARTKDVIEMIERGLCYEQRMGKDFNDCNCSAVADLRL